uniref:NADH-ubiquinone oxidoreductase chain 4L n=1 Tax=Omosita colon TaxID=878176 RepID=A0A7H1DJM9_9CUCU|nr:NADH dehydrogenase subunit 4L [Omosita colon]QNS37171.1 NADH dehydrogenase subunit 4L [Omosita colon]QVG61295.1 NADH dehydrogenase subunit 4L [Omosita colon]
MMIFLYLSLFMFMSGLIIFCLKSNHLLIMLLSLEFIVLSLYFLIFMYLSYMMYNYFFSMLFLSFSVCEGVLGLSVLVSMIRSVGNDYVLTFSSLW